MNYVISSKYTQDSYFMQWLTQIIRVRCQKAINPRKLTHLTHRIVVDNVFNLTPSQLRGFNLYRELTKAAKHIGCRKVKDYYIVYVPSNIFITNTSIPLSTLSRFVCYGDLTTKGYPILTSVINNVIANIAKYYKDYMNLFFGGI